MIIAKTHANSAIIEPNLNALTPPRGQFLHFISQYNLPQPALENWELVFTEVVSNAIKHGSNPKSNDIVRIHWGQSNNYTLLVVADNGSGPTSKYIENPRLPQNPLALSGRGMYIISIFADLWGHQKTNYGYQQTIVKQV